MKKSSQQQIKKYASIFLTVYKNYFVPEDYHFFVAYRNFLRKNKFLVRNKYPQELLAYAATYAYPQVRAEIMLMVKELITILYKHDILVFLPEIVDFIAKKLLATLGYEKAVIYSSHPINVQEQHEIAQDFQTLIGQKIIPEYAFDETLIAGIKIVSQNFMWESSVAQKIQKIKG